MINYQLKKLRIAKNLSQEQLADELNISQSTYSRIENGNQNWAKYLNEICDFFNIEPSILFVKELPLNNSKKIQTNREIDNSKNQIDEKEKIINILEKQVELLEEKIQIHKIHNEN
ncbi:helix-turn-helix transcriptional regulator [Marivirga salinae]|uniref:Helix-turn-helix transcriptional regulator n=1 Tax=Marivirga salinarum TaxID=3059078 RepID=A0AA49JB81_9BACT|nr:helix-turn-helix transcriptional regulator [Marivirga sp. BDSF4-3]WKK73993.1 helix-turn-helix transcriptional regulator [Marivirga sp. BDSF4-3]